MHIGFIRNTQQCSSTAEPHCPYLHIHPRRISRLQQNKSKSIPFQAVQFMAGFAENINGELYRTCTNIKGIVGSTAIRCHHKRPGECLELHVWKKSTVCRHLIQTECAAYTKHTCCVLNSVFSKSLNHLFQNVPTLTDIRQTLRYKMKYANFLGTQECGGLLFLSTLPQVLPKHVNKGVQSLGSLVQQEIPLESLCQLSLSLIIPHKECMVGNNTPKNQRPNRCDGKRKRWHSSWWFKEKKCCKENKRSFKSSKLTCQMEHFPDLLDLFLESSTKGAVENILEKGKPFKKTNKLGRW